MLSSHTDGRHPIDAKYDELRTRLEPIEVGSELHVLLERYMVATHAPTHKTYTLELLQAFHSHVT